MTKPRTDSDLIPPGSTPPDDVHWTSPELTAQPDPDWVPCRWIDQQAGFSPLQGLHRYGDPFWASEEQLAHDPRLIPWDEPWEPDPIIFAASRQEG